MAEARERWEPQSDYIRRPWLAGWELGWKEGFAEGLAEVRGEADAELGERVRRLLIKLGTRRFGQPGASALAALADAGFVALTDWVAAVDRASSWDDLLGR